MQNLLLLVQTSADVLALEPARKAIAGQFEGIWLVFSPAVLVDSDSASAEHDKVLSGLKDAERGCAARGDYDGAKQYKAKHDEAVLEKATRVSEGYKTLTKEQSDAAFERLFGAFLKAQPAPKIQADQTADHYGPGDWIALLNSLKGGWHPAFVPGRFSVAWPTSFLEPQFVRVSGQSSPEISTKALDNTVSDFVAAGRPPKPEVKKPSRPVNPRRRELMMMTLDQLGEIAFKAGFTPSGSRMAILNEIIRVEEAKNPPVPASV